MIDPNIESNTENYSPLEVTGQMEIFLYISKFIKNKLCRKLHLSSSHFRCKIIQSQYIRMTKYPCVYQLTVDKIYYYTSEEFSLYKTTVDK